MERWETLESRLVVDTPWMRVRADRVLMPDVEEPETFHVVEYPDWSCVVCLDHEHRLVLVQQYRHGLGKICLGLPAGIIDEGETPLVAAKRELEEESGGIEHAVHVMALFWAERRGLLAPSAE